MVWSFGGNTSPQMGRLSTLHATPRDAAGRTRGQAFSELGAIDLLILNAAGSAKMLLNPINEYSSAFPILECIHIAGIVCGVGTAALVNLRLLGVGITQNSAARFWSDVTPWTLGGLTLAIFSGLLLFSADPAMYYVNPAFRFKMLILLLAIVFYFTRVRMAVTRGAQGSMVACISLGMWALVPAGGIFIGFMG